MPGNSWTWRHTFVSCLIGVCVCLAIGFTASERGGDFTEFYAAGKLVGSGDLYNWDRVQQVERLQGDILIPFGRLPFYALLFKPISTLPHAWGRAVWLLLNAMALGAFVLLWPVKNRNTLLMALCWCCPAAVLLSTGQDTAMFLLFAALGFRLLQTNHDFAAGLVFSLCAAKFHLAIAIPVYLLARRRWTALFAGALSGAVQLAVSFAVEGRGWPARLLNLASNSEFSPAASKMPNLLGLTHWMPYGLYIEAVLSLLVLAAVWLIAQRATPVAGATVTIIGGLLVSHHAYVYDAVLLLPALALASELSLPEMPRYWVLLLSTPLPYVALMTDRVAPIAQAAISLSCVALLVLLAGGCLKTSFRLTNGWPQMTPAAEGEG